MEPIFKDSGKLKGVEVLFFDDVELEKSKNGQRSFASSGTLSVLYFKEYNRFILHLNDWRYPLMRRIPVNLQDTQGSFSLSLPALNEFDYVLRFPSNINSAAFSNFKTILLNNSGLSSEGGEKRKLEASPDDKLSRESLQQSGPSVTEKFTEVIKSGVDKVKHLAHGVKPGTKNLTSTKHSMNIKDIKNKDFKKEAHSTFKKDFFENEESLSKQFSELRGHNRNVSEVKEFDDLRKTSDSNAPSLYLWREEIEESILNNKDIIQQRHFVTST